MKKQLETIFNDMQDDIKNKKGKEAALFGRGYENHKISQENFMHITKIVSTKKSCFIDGGSTLIIDSPSIAIGFIRTVAVIVESNQNIKILNKEFFVLVKAEKDESKVVYKTTYFSKEEDENNNKNIKSRNINVPMICIDSEHRGFATESSRLSPSKVIDIVRKIAETAIAKEAAGTTLDDGDIIILDGSLRAFCIEEKNAFEELYQTCSERKILICALSKTCSAITDSGETLISAIQNISPKNELWYYYPLAKSKTDMHKAEIFIVRLNKKAKHLFWLELYNEQAKNADFTKIIGFLSYMSRDISFPGYPYWLIKADRLARVSEKDKEMMYVLFLGIKGAEEIIRPLINTGNAHAILDNM